MGRVTQRRPERPSTSRRTPPHLTSPWSLRCLILSVNNKPASIVRVPQRLRGCATPQL